MASAGETSGQSIIEMEPSKRRFRHSIFEVPSYLRDLHPSAYEPTIISFGPYHYGKETLKAMEDVKGEYRESFVRRNPEKSFEDYLKAVRMIKNKARDNYGNFVTMGDEEFVEMMTLDGCVIIEVINRLIVDEERGNVNMNMVDPILLDMILLENQIPFIVLETIWAVQAAERQILPLVRYFLRQISKIYSPNTDDEGVFDWSTRPLHLLHLLDLTMFPNSASGFARDVPKKLSIPGMSHLLNRGMKLNKNNRPGLKVSCFESVISMKPLKITKHTIACFRNLTAFEQYYKGAGAMLRTSSYVVHMNSLIQGPEDLDALSSNGQGILTWDSKEIEGQDVVNLFKTLSQGLSRYDDTDFCSKTVLYWFNKPEFSHTNAAKIFRVPEHVRNLNPYAFKPRLVSFGPYHRGKEHLQHMESQKMHCRDEILAMYKKNLDGCLEAVREIEDEARLHYEEPLGLGDDKDFAEMMVLDGCFMIYLILRSNWRFNNDISRDILLIENQIPFIVLQNISQYLDCLPLLQIYLREFLNNNCSPYEGRIERGIHEAPCHLVELLRRQMFPMAGCKKFYEEYPPGRSKAPIIPQLSQLRSKGVKIVRTEGLGLTIDFVFHQRKLRINRLDISHDTNIYLQNVIAFEQNYERADKTASTYVVLMNNLIGSTEDVDVLTSTNRGIITNILTSAEDVVNMFKNLCEGVEKFNIDPFLTYDVNKYVNSRRQKWMSDLKENYLKTPWLFISLLGAFLLLSLTTLQTGYTIASFYKGK